MDLRRALHPRLHPRTLSPSRPLVLARVAGLAVVDYECAVNHHQAGPRALLIALAVVASTGGVIWSFARPRRPAAQSAALAVMALAGGLLGALQHGSPALAFPAVSVVQVVADGAALEAVAIGALALVALEAGVIWAKLDSRAALGYPAILLGSALFGLSRRQYVMQTRAARALVEQTKETQAATRRAAALDERTRIAREIHDVLAHALGGLAVQLDAAELLLSQRADIPGALERIRSSQRTAREGLEEARRAVAALRTDAPPLRESLEGLIESHSEQGSGAELTVEGTERALPPETSLTLMRTVQEALTNARRHAPGSAVKVQLIYGTDSTRVTVTNDAATREPIVVGGLPTGGYGLAGMRERLEIAGGQLSAGPEPAGWAVSAEVPT